MNTIPNTPSARSCIHVILLITNAHILLPAQQEIVCQHRNVIIINKQDRTPTVTLLHNENACSHVHNIKIAC